MSEETYEILIEGGKDDLLISIEANPDNNVVLLIIDKESEWSTGCLTAARIYQAFDKCNSELLNRLPYEEYEKLEKEQIGELTKSVKFQERAREIGKEMLDYLFTIREEVDIEADNANIIFTGCDYLESLAHDLIGDINIV